MDAEEKTTVEERYQYLRRKGLIRLMGTNLQRHPRSRERGST